MNKYELTLIVNAKIEDDDRAATVEQAKENITNNISYNLIFLQQLIRVAGK